MANHIVFKTTKDTTPEEAIKIFGSCNSKGCTDYLFSDPIPEKGEEFAYYQVPYTKSVRKIVDRLMRILTERGSYFKFPGRPTFSKKGAISMIIGSFDPEVIPSDWNSIPIAINSSHRLYLYYLINIFRDIHVINDKRFFDLCDKLWVPSSVSGAFRLNIVLSLISFYMTGMKSVHTGGYNNLRNGVFKIAGVDQAISVSTNGNTSLRSLLNSGLRIFLSNRPNDPDKGVDNKVTDMINHILSKKLEEGEKYSFQSLLIGLELLCSGVGDGFDPDDFIFKYQISKGFSL